jgi:hypothetical protein
MRRRAWTFIQQCDIMISFQMGLPSMIGLRTLEPFLPRNIRDDDEAFNETCTSLPPALPDSAPTQISYLIAKAKLAFGFARALDEVGRSPMPQWERILEIDRDLRRIYDGVPDHYKLGQLSIQDPLVLVSARFVLLSIHHKSLCVVHSRFLQAAKSDNRFMYSRRVCLTSALAILRFQVIQDQDIPVNGQVRSLTNYQTSLAIHDYLLAATIIAADLYSDNHTDSTTSAKGSDGIPTRIEMIKALRTSAEIFGRSQQYSAEAEKAASVLGMIVKKLETGPRRGGRTATAQENIMRATGVTTVPSPSSGPSSPHLYSNVSETPSSSVSENMQQSRRMTSEVRARYTMPTPPSSSRNLQSTARPTDAAVLMQNRDLDAFTAWSTTNRGNPSAQVPPFHQHSHDFDLSGGSSSIRDLPSLPVS